MSSEYSVHDVDSGNSTASEDNQNVIDHSRMDYCSVMIDVLCMLPGEMRLRQHCHYSK